MKEEDQPGLVLAIWQESLWQWGGGFRSGTSVSVSITVIQRLGGMAAPAPVTFIRQLSSPACGKGA